MKKYKAGYEDAARKAAEVVTVDEERRKAFIKGVRWGVENIFNKIKYDHYEDHPGYPTKFMRDLSLKDIRKSAEDFIKGEYVECDE